MQQQNVLFLVAPGVDSTHLLTFGSEYSDPAQGFRERKHFFQKTKLIDYLYDDWMKSDGSSEGTKAGGLLQDMIVDPSLLEHDTHDEASKTSADDEDPEVRGWRHGRSVSMSAELLESGEEGNEGCANRKGADALYN